MTPDAPTRGELTVVRFGTAELLFRCHTLELNWANNHKRVSCIPVGHYTMRFLPTQKFPRLSARAPWYRNYLWELTDVSGRSEVKIHHGNTVKDTEGCPLVGMGVSKAGITQSIEALRQLHAVLSPFESGPVTLNVFELPSAK